MTEDVETRDERRARQAVEGRAAMADYRRKQDAEMEKARRLRALRLAREEMSSLSASTGRDQRATGERLRAKPIFHPTQRKDPDAQRRGQVFQGCLAAKASAYGKPNGLQA
jgi:hypothetical protein